MNYSCTHSLSEMELSFMNDFNDMISLPELQASAPTNAPTTTTLPSSNYAPLPDKNGGGKPSTPTSRGRQNSVEVPNATSHLVQISKQTCPKQQKQLRNHAEKKRREKLQAKFKRLRDALPNSQKLDSASLLDRAISHIKTLQCELHPMMQQMCAMNPYTFVPAYELQFAGSTVMSPYPFVPRMRLNYSITGMNTNHHSVQPGLCSAPFLPQTSAAGAASTVWPPSFPPNPYGCYDQPQLQAMPVHARNTLPNYPSEGNHRGK